jgi:hypothetical protein
LHALRDRHLSVARWFERGGDACYGCRRDPHSPFPMSADSSTISRDRLPVLRRAMLEAELRCFAA